MGSAISRLIPVQCCTELTSFHQPRLSSCTGRGKRQALPADCCASAMPGHTAAARATKVRDPGVAWCFPRTRMIRCPDPNTLGPSPTLIMDRHDPYVTSVVGQTEKNSARTNLFRSALELTSLDDVGMSQTCQQRTFKSFICEGRGKQKGRLAAASPKSK